MDFGIGLEMEAFEVSEGYSVPSYLFAYEVPVPSEDGNS